MFHGCQALTEVNLSNFDTSKVTNMIGIFSKCSNLTYIDISKFSSQTLNNESYYLFEGKSPNGTVKFNSKFFNKEFINNNFEGWEVIDLILIELKKYYI